MTDIETTDDPEATDRTTDEAATDSDTALELRFFANFRQAVGQKTIHRTYEGAETVGDVLRAVEDEFPDLAGLILDDDGEVLPQLSVLRNGREVEHLDGVETTIAPGDTVSVFPPVAGG